MKDREEEELIGMALSIRIRQPKIGCKKIYKMIKINLEERGLKYGRDKFISIMQREGLGVRRKKRYKNTTNSMHNLLKSDNLIKGRRVSRTDEVWVSDITYLRTREGFMYLSIVSDLYSRKILGYSLSEDMQTIRNIESLEMAIKNSKTGKGALIHHSDRGIQYCSKEYRSMLSKYKISSSMTKGGSPEENAVAERINGILKTEYLISDKKQTKQECREIVRESIEIYNRERPHMSLDYKTPNEKYEE